MQKPMQYAIWVNSTDTGKHIRSCRTRLLNVFVAVVVAAFAQNASPIEAIARI